MNKRRRFKAKRQRAVVRYLKTYGERARSTIRYALLVEALRG